jgi:hypothetical protein
MAGLGVCSPWPSASSHSRIELWRATRDRATVWGTVALGVILLGVVLAPPVYWSHRHTQRIGDPLTRARVERVEEERWRWRRDRPDGSPHLF